MTTNVIILYSIIGVYGYIIGGAIFWIIDEKVNYGRYISSCKKFSKCTFCNGCTCCNGGRDITFIFSWPFGAIYFIYGKLLKYIISRKERNEKLRLQKRNEIESILKEI